MIADGLVRPYKRLLIIYRIQFCILVIMHDMIS